MLVPLHVLIEGVDLGDVAKPAQIAVQALTDEDVASLRPAMRGLLADRYERLWQMCVDERAGRNGLRWAELEARVLGAMSKLWRLDVAAKSDEGEDDGASRAVVTEAARRAAIASVDQLSRNLPS